MGHIAKGNVNANKFRFFNYHTNLTKIQNTTINIVLNEKTKRLGCKGIDIYSSNIFNLTHSVCQ